jgi:hypothetical protein
MAAALKRHAIAARPSVRTAFIVLVPWELRLGLF